MLIMLVDSADEDIPNFNIEQEQIMPVVSGSDTVSLLLWQESWSSH